MRKEARASASGAGKRYLSRRTASRGQYRSLLICRSSPGLCERDSLQDKSNRTSTIEELRRILARKRDVLRDLAHQLHDLCDVIVVLAVPRTRRGIEEVVTAGNQLEYLPEKDETTINRLCVTHDASHAPDISTSSPLCPKNDFGTPVLTGLDIIREMMLRPCCCQGG